MKNSWLIFCESTMYFRKMKKLSKDSPYFQLFFGYCIIPANISNLF